MIDPIDNKIGSQESQEKLSITKEANPCLRKMFSKSSKAFLFISCDDVEADYCYVFNVRFDVYFLLPIFNVKSFCFRVNRRQGSFSFFPILWSATIYCRYYNPANFSSSVRIFFKTQHDTTFYSADPSIDREFLSENKRNIKCIIHGYKIKIDEMLRDQCFSKENLPIKKSFVRLLVEYIFAFLSYHLCYFRLTQRLFISCLND